MPEPRSEAQHHKIILEYLTRHLHILEEQRAKAGMFVPPYITINIEDVREEIAVHRYIIDDLESAHLLSGLCICFHCGSRLDDFLLRRKQAGDWDHIRPFYMCPKSFDDRSCENQPIDAEVLDVSCFKCILKDVLTDNRLTELLEAVNERLRTGEPPCETTLTTLKYVLRQPEELLDNPASRLTAKRFIAGFVDKVEVSSEPRLARLYYKRP